MAESPRGKFVWYELVTTDPGAAQEFYTDVVGWSTAPFEHAAGMDYTMWMKGETPVGGLMELPAEACASGVPPHWLGYVAVPDVDAAKAQAEELGGRTIMGPHDIADVGRFVILADPQGAVFSAYKSAQETPATNAEPGPGDFSWHELATTDYEAAFDFYSDLFGWEKQQAMDMGEAGVYQMYGRGGNMLGGMYNKTVDQPGPPAWLYYITIGDLDATVGRVTKKGGKIVVGPMEVPGGSRIAMGIDPQGAAFGLHQRAAI
ncbi:MAG TPA: VOC family protein [Gemmatimonadota bacterium]|nr:VOC family protein [Gemmatimonadota bacterium]